MKLYNSLTEKKEELGEPLDGKTFKMYVCGPTVYDYAHLGHARVAVVFDAFKRYLVSKGCKVYYLQNITDIDDKIIDRARKEKVTAKHIARKFEKEYKHNMKILNVASVDKYPRASDYIKEIQRQIEGLMNKGYAYKTSSGIYFEVKKFADYGKLSKQNLDELRPSYRIEPDPEKKDVLDFALWKFKKTDDEPSWDSPWGEGRPGWHIEDTAITQKHFGPQYDIHGGGMDLKFPHHEAEIAQQESLSGKKPLARIWMHIGLLLSGGKKMSKSLNNFLTINDFLKKYPASVFRLLVLSHQYRSPIDYSSKMADDAMQNLISLSQTVAKLPMADGVSPSGIKISEYEKKFEEKMNDDFNTPEALAVIFSFVRNANKIIWSLNRNEANELKTWIDQKLKILGIKPLKPKIPLKIKWLSRKRELLRRKKQFVKADALRKKIEELGYIIEDTPNGPFVWPINAKD